MLARLSCFALPALVTCYADIGCLAFVLCLLDFLCSACLAYLLRLLCLRALLVLLDLLGLRASWIWLLTNLFSRFACSFLGGAMGLFGYHGWASLG